MSTPIENNTEELQEILQTVNNLPNLGGSGSSDVFIVHVTLDENFENVVSVDKTYEEIVEAANNGKACFAVAGGSRVVPMWYSLPSEGEIIFGVSNGNSSYAFYFYDDGSFEYEYYHTEPYTLYVNFVLDNGEVTSGVISAENELNLFYAGLYNSGIKLNTAIISADEGYPIAGYNFPVNVGYTTPIGGNGCYYARTFVKEGYFDTSFYEEEENEEYRVRWELSFTKTT